MNSVIDFTTASSAPEVAPANITPSYSEPVNQPEETVDLSKYSFYVNGVTQPHYEIYGDGDQSNRVDEDYLYLDIELNVGCPGKTVKITKRIKLCKKSLVNSALMKDGIMSATAQFIESQQDKGRRPDQRILELAGISHPKNFV